jgi:hypothetical protein
LIIGRMSSWGSGRCCLVILTSWFTFRHIQSLDTLDISLQGPEISKTRVKSSHIVVVLWEWAHLGQTDFNRQPQCPGRGLQNLGSSGYRAGTRPVGALR